MTSIDDNSFDVLTNCKLESNNDIKRFLSSMISVCKKSFNNRNKDKKIIWDSVSSILICNSILNNLGINNTIVNIENNVLTYEFIVARIKLHEETKIYVIDPNYGYFLEQQSYENKILQEMISRNKKRNSLKNNLVEHGFFEYSDDNMKNYMDGFVLAIYNYNKNKEDWIFETTFTGQEYYENVICRRIIPKLKIKKRG